MPDPLVGDFNIAGLNFQWGAEGIFGISASPMGADGYRTLYFSPLSSNTEFAVSTRILRDESKVTGSYRDFKVVGSRGRDTHTTAKVMDITGVQLFSLIDQNAIGCWSSRLPLKPQNIAIADKDDVGLIFPSDVKIDAGRNVWVISDRMPVFLESELNYGDVNFRIYVAPMEKLIQGTVCEVEPPIITTPRSLSVHSPRLQTISQIPSKIFLPGTSPSPLTSSYNPFISQNVISNIPNQPMYTRDPSRSYFFPPSQNNNRQWWLNNN